MIFVVVVLFLWRLLVALGARRWQRVEVFPAYVIGTAATYWFLERTGAIIL